VTARDQTQHKLHERCGVLAKVVQSLTPIYHAPDTTETQRHLLETMIGAAIWYLPQSKQLWTGRISVAAIGSFHPTTGAEKPKLTADHEFPRKVAARELLTSSWVDDSQPAEKLMQLYQSRYGRFNYITPAENRKLMRYQRTDAFQTISKSYANAGITLVPVTSSELVSIRSRNSDLIDIVLGRA